MKILLVILFCCGGRLLAQKPVNSSIRKVSAYDVRALIDSSDGPTIVNFWATWCGPCIREIPWFDSIIALKRAPVKLYLVSLDFKTEYPNKLLAFVSKHGYRGEVMYLNDTHSEQYIPIIAPKWKGTIPTSIFVNKSNNYYHVFNEQIPRQRFGLELDKLLGQ